MNYYPVIIPTLNRFRHFKECVESLASCTHADKTELVIGLDYPPSEKYVEGWKQIKEYIPTIKGFSKITVFEHERNLGAFGNIDFLTNYITEHHDAYIFTEDDNVFSPCFLDYMDKCLEKYKDDKSVLAISGYMNPVAFSCAKKIEANIVRIQDFMAWGIGKWKRTDIELNTYMPDHYMKYVCSHRYLLKKMKNNLRELYQLIFWTKSNKNLDRKCDFTIACYCIINNKFVINPMLSLVRNMGYDGSGEHCGELKDNYLARQQISFDTIFNLTDTLSEQQFVQCRKEWETWKQKTFSESQKKHVLKYYRLYMFFGYVGGELFQKIRLAVKIPLKKLYRLFTTK